MPLLHAVRPYALLLWPRLAPCLPPPARQVVRRDAPAEAPEVPEGAHRHLVDEGPPTLRRGCAPGVQRRGSIASWFSFDCRFGGKMPSTRSARMRDKVRRRLPPGLEPGSAGPWLISPTPAAFLSAFTDFVLRLGRAVGRSPRIARSQVPANPLAHISVASFVYVAELWGESV